MNEVKWVKLFTDLFDSRKMRRLRRQPEGDTTVLIWIMLLALAGKTNDGGKIYLEEEEPYTPDTLAEDLDFEPEQVQTALTALEQARLLEWADGHPAITHWEDYQNVERLEEIREMARMRKQRQRANQKLSQDCHVTVTGRHALEEEGEEEVEAEAEQTRTEAEEKQTRPEKEVVVVVVPEEEKPLRRDGGNNNNYNNYGGGKNEVSVPTLEEVKAYCKQEGLNMIPEAFYDYNAIRRWRTTAGQPLDWRACARRWATIAKADPSKQLERDYGNGLPDGWGE